MRCRLKMGIQFEYNSKTFVFELHRIICSDYDAFPLCGVQTNGNSSNGDGNGIKNEKQRENRQYSTVFQHSFLSSVRKFINYAFAYDMCFSFLFYCASEPLNVACVFLMIFLFCFRNFIMNFNSMK